MDIQDLKDKKVAILGFGQEGQAVAEYLNRHNISYAVFDELPLEEWNDVQKQLIDRLQFQSVTGKNNLSEIALYHVIFRSPGFWRNHPVLIEAGRNGALITSQTKWTFAHNSGTIIGVTGTKGKGTTCSLLSLILQTAQQKGEIDSGTIYLTGNIGKIQPLDFLDSLQPSDIVIYELSSFQLQDLESSPHIGICLMVTSDHLNHHKDLSEYHHAKSAICKFQKADDVAIYNVDFPASKTIGQGGFGNKLQISSEVKPANGAYIQNDSIEIALENRPEFILDCTNRKLRGKHNLQNIAAASTAALIAGASPDTIGQCVVEFAGLEHRLQFVGTIHGANYFNDSVSSNPDTTIAAIQSFKEPLILILGGSDKGLDYTNLVKDIISQSHIKAIATIGETGKTIAALLKEHNFTKPIIEQTGDFKTTLSTLSEIASAGDAVVLSPASASFDMFKNYADRGDQFIAFVKSEESKA